MSKIFASKNFYKLVFKVTIPIMLQQALINIVSLADNIMLGQLNEDVISGVYIATKILFVVTLTIFGAIGGASIYFAQFVGSNDEKHIRQCFDFKILFDFLFGFICMIVIFFFGKQLASLFVKDSQASIAASYLKVYTFSIPFLVISNIIGTSFREIKKAHIPMIGSIIALFTNIGLNYVFIFMLDKGAVGAAIATVIARLFEASFAVIYCIIKKPIFYHNIFKDFHIDLPLFKELVRHSVPLVINEFLWSLGQTTLVLAYSKVTELASPALSISQTLFDFFYLATNALGSGICVIMGAILGANEIKEAKEHVLHFFVITIGIGIFMGGLLALVGPLLANIYNVSDEARTLAIKMCYLNALLMCLYSLNCSAFYIIRSGGLTSIIFIFDSMFVWAIQVPVALMLAYKSSLLLNEQFLIVNLLEIIKLIASTCLLKSGKWIKNLTNI